MQVWHYHSPGLGRQGPFDVGTIGRHYRERRIGPETPLRREGMSKWQPLDWLRGELDLIGVEPDATLPPPLPARPGDVGPEAQVRRIETKRAPDRARRSLIIGATWHERDRLQGGCIGGDLDTRYHPKICTPGAMATPETATAEIVAPEPGESTEP